MNYVKKNQSVSQLTDFQKYKYKINRITYNLVNLKTGI